MQDDSFAANAGDASQRLSAGQTKSLGTVHDQRFFAVRSQPGYDLPFPFPKDHFNSLIAIRGCPAEETLQSVAMQLLRHGMRAGICHGEGAEMMGSMIDGLVDEYGFSHNERTVYASVHDDEELDEVIDYFVLPNGLADIGLIVVIGEESAFEDVLFLFNHVTGQVRERVLAGAV